MYESAWRKINEIIINFYLSFSPIKPPSAANPLVCSNVSPPPPVNQICPKPSLQPSPLPPPLIVNVILSYPWYTILTDDEHVSAMTNTKSWMLYILLLHLDVGGGILSYAFLSFKQGLQGSQKLSSIKSLKLKKTPIPGFSLL